MMTPAQREAVVAETLTWLRTPYHHGGDEKGRGVDCAKILIRVYSAALGIPYFDPGPYPPDWHLHRSEERYLENILPYAREVAEREPLPGDFFIFQWGRTFAHSAIVIAYPMVIHAHAQDRMVAWGDVRNAPFIDVKGQDRKRKLMEVLWAGS